MALSTGDKKLLWHLTSGYLKAPDPEKWAVAADLLEDAGDAEGAAKWRARAVLFPPLKAKWDEVRTPRYWGRASALYPRGPVIFHLSTHTRRATVTVLVRCCQSKDIIHQTAWRKRSQTPTYHAEKLIQLIDWVRERYPNALAPQACL